VIGRLHHVIFDCPDPAGLAAFYSALLGLPVTYQEDDFAVVSVNDTTSGIAFQRVADYHPPRWPDPVYADPVGHPFCLIPRPGWAPPIGV
jgi:catechol 2,3-dioxygenase-like lactoylglutathione lyase family enzyme